MFLIVSVTLQPEACFAQKPIAVPRTTTGTKKAGSPSAKKGVKKASTPVNSDKKNNKELEEQRDKIREQERIIEEQRRKIEEQERKMKENEENAVPSEKPVVKNTKESNEVFVAVEQQAEFPGGYSALYKWLANNVKYPEEAYKEGIQGRVNVKFIIEKDGSITQAQIVRSPHESLSKEALRVVYKMPKWQPGRNNGTAVRTYYSLPISFKLQNK